MSELRSMHFLIPAIPIAQPRPKATVLNGHVRVYGAKKSHPVHAFKATCRMAFEQQRYGSKPIDYPMGLDLTFVLPRPKLPKKYGTDRMRHGKRPDFDNLEKSVVDALTGLAWTDDALLCDVRTQKWIAAEGESPHVEVTLRELIL